MQQKAETVFKHQGVLAEKATTPFLL